MMLYLCPYLISQLNTHNLKLNMGINIMEVKGKKISLLVGVNRRVPDIAVSMSFLFNGVANCCLKKLSCNCAPTEKKEVMRGGHEAALAYAIFETVRDKLVGSPLETGKSRVSNISCKYINGFFTINWNCQGTGSSLRKTAGLAISCLHPHKLFSKYSENIKFLSMRAGNKEEFAYCVKKVNDGLKEIYITSVGKINIDITKLKDILAIIEKKIPALENIGPGAEPHYVNEEAKIEYPFIKCNGAGAAAVADYIRSNSGGMGVDVVNNGVIIYNTSWASKHKQLADNRRINDFVEKKYNKFNVDEFYAIFTYFSLTQGYIGAKTAANIIKTKYTAKKMGDLIKEILK